MSGVDRSRLMADLEALARWTKLAGTPEEAASLAYLRGRLDAAGFHTTLLHHEAYISLPGPARLEVDGLVLAAITHSMGLPTPPGGLRVRLALPDDAAPGLALLLDGIASPAAALAATRAGAAALVHVSPHEHLHEMCVSPVWGSPGPDTAGMLPTTVVVTISHADGAALRARLAHGEAVEITLHAAVDTGWRSTPLLVAEMSAPAGPDLPFVLLSGHHDTWFEGVMDNGAANATMLEVARVLAADRASWCRGLRLCFWSGHSQGRYSGSAWYADTHWDELERRCVAHVNVDSTGGAGATVLTQAPMSAELAALGRDAIRAVSGQEAVGRRMARNGDQSFSGIGIPSLFATLSEQPPGPVQMRNALGWWWHTRHDLLDKIDPALLERDTRIYLHVLHRLLTEAALPMDPCAAMAELLHALDQLALLPAHGLDVSVLRAEAAALRDMDGTARGDAAMMRACRALVPLAMTTGDRFAHDPALPQEAWPVLDALRALGGVPPGTDAAHLARIAAQRALNRVRHGIREARDARR